MPESPAIWFAAVMLWLLDASLNVSMEPFRAFVGDMLHRDQHSAGYAVQTAFIGAGAVVGSLFPAVMEALGVANVAPPGQIPDTVRYARSEEPTSELQSLMSISYAVLRLK